MSMITIKKWAIFLLMVFPGWVFSQQVSDENYLPEIHKPAYDMGKGPVLYVDEGHVNFHTKDFRYQPFAKLLERDGYRVTSYKGSFIRSELLKGKILVISNALNAINEEDWFVPTPSAFTNDEIDIVRQWVYEGGNLFLIADHMPMAGAAQELAAVFGFEFTNGFALDTTKRGPALFNGKENSLVESMITKGRDSSERVKQVATFTGQAFQIPDDALPILVLGENFVNFIPDTAWVFTDTTPRLHAKGWSQGAYRTFGQGKVVVFGEAAMFTAQLAGPQKIKMGMNHNAAPENYQLLLNIIHWLDGLLY